MVNDYEEDFKTYINFFSGWGIDGISVQRYCVETIEGK